MEISGDIPDQPPIAGELHREGSLPTGNNSLLTAEYMQAMNIPTNAEPGVVRPTGAKLHLLGVRSQVLT